MSDDDEVLVLSILRKQKWFMPQKSNGFENKQVSKEERKKVSINKFIMRHG